jgi:uncharacterized protein (DUF1684 family)
MHDESETMSQEAIPTWLDLYDYRRRVAGMYRERERALRAGEDEARTLEKFRASKDALFAGHPQSALNPDQRSNFAGLSYFPHNPLLRVEALLTPESPGDGVIEAADGPHILPMRRAARLAFTVENSPLQLVVYWIDVYGGGLFLPFRDATCPDESYGGGRYLFDTVKGSDFLTLASVEGGTPQGHAAGGGRGTKIILDFNYAYNPSCAYDSRWVCPLAPHENRLPVHIRAGEKKYDAG